MAITLRSPKHAGSDYLLRILMPRILSVVLSFSFCFIPSIEAQEKTQYPDDLACPVTANLFPEQVRRIDFIRFIFRGGNAFPRRISIALIHPQNNDISIEYRWVGKRVNRTGMLVANGKGKTDCFFLRIVAISEDDFCKEFIFFIPENISIKEIAFSSRESEKPIVLCPMPELEQEINEAYVACGLNPKDESKASLLIQLLEKITPKYDCRRPFDYEPVPAWWMASEGASDRWIEYLHHKVLENNADALRVYVKFYENSDGHIAEEMSEQMWWILKDRPLLILEKWTGIDENKKWVLMCRPWPSQGGSPLISEMIEIYKDIARKEPKYKSACDEIISILSEKSQDVFRHNLLHWRYMA